MPFRSQNDGSSRASSAVVVSENERINGWQCPWHYLQFVAWFFLVFFGIGHFALIVPCLNTEWRPAAYIIPGCLYLIHFILHLMCLTIDPADPNIRTASRGKASWFDRTQHRHVIENNHCYICQVDVAPQSKHCSVCNKCVAEFDHHCKWLNNCIGGRNYRLFLGCVMSALALALVVFVINLYVFIILFIQPEVIENNLGGDYKLFRVVPMKAFLSFLAIHGLLLLLAIGLLAHLLGFHFYLIWHEMTTYEFIVNGRNKHSRQNVDLESGERRPPKIVPLKNNKVKPSSACDTNRSISADIPRPNVEIINELEPRQIHVPRSVPHKEKTEQLEPSENITQTSQRYDNVSSSEESLHPTPSRSHAQSPSPVRIASSDNETEVPPLNGILTSSQHSEGRISFNEVNVTPRTITSVKAEVQEQNSSESEEELIPVNKGFQRPDIKTYHQVRTEHHNEELQSIPPPQNYNELLTDSVDERSRSPSPFLDTVTSKPKRTKKHKTEYQEGTGEAKKKKKKRSRSRSPEEHDLPPVVLRRPLPPLPYVNESDT